MEKMASHSKRSAEQVVNDNDVDISERGDEAGIVDEDDEYETSYFVIEFPELEGTTLLQNGKRIKLNGLFTENPSCTIDSHLFKAEHGFSLGSTIVVDRDASRDCFVVTNTHRSVTCRLSHIATNK